MGAKTSTELAAELLAARAKRKPVPTDAEKLEAAEVQRLQAELDAEYLALRAEENAGIIAQYAPTKARQFFDFDPDMVHPATIEHLGHTCTLHSRFVMRHANTDDMDVFDDAKRAIADAQKTPVLAAQLASTSESTTRQLGRKCIVYPEPVKGPGAAQHYLDVDASFWYFGSAGMALGNAAALLGGLQVSAHQAKS